MSSQRDAARRPGTPRLTHGSTVAEEHLPELVGGFRLEAGGHVAVQIECDRHAGVAETLAHDLRMYAGAQHETGRCVT